MKKCIIWVVIIVLLGCIGFEVYFIVNENKKEDLAVSNEVETNPGENKEKFEIYIKHTTFSGPTSEEEWEREKEDNDKKEPQKYEVYEGAIIALDAMTMDNLEIEVKSVSENEIKIKASEKMSYSEDDDGKISLLDTKRNFTIKKGSKLELVTPTMDASDTYEIEYR